MATREDIKKVNEYCTTLFGVMTAKMRANGGNYYWFTDGHKIMMNNERRLTQYDKRKHDLLGVYNTTIKTAELRDDLLWYIETHLEVQQ